MMAMTLIMMVMMIMRQPGYYSGWDLYELLMAPARHATRIAPHYLSTWVVPWTGEHLWNTYTLTNHLLSKAEDILIQTEVLQLLSWLSSLYVHVSANIVVAFISYCDCKVPVQHPNGSKKSRVLSGVAWHCVVLMCWCIELVERPW